MIHKACMPVYMNSGKIVAGGRVDGDSKVLQEVLADLKIYCQENYVIKKNILSNDPC